MSIISDESIARSRQLCRQLAIHRVARGLTQRDMAAHFGDRQSNVQRIETMTVHVPTLPTVVAYAWALDLEVGLAAPHHLPLLDLTADEIRALMIAGSLWADNDNDPTLRAALAKLLPGALDKLTTTEEPTDV